MIRHAVLFVPRLVIAAAAAALVAGVAIPLFWLRDRRDPRSIPVDHG